MIASGVPVEWPGSEAERILNRNSHQWIAADDCDECAFCCSKRGSISSDWPCGVEPPRQAPAWMMAGPSLIDAIVEADSDD